jgi:hypothetical protein
MIPRILIIDPRCDVGHDVGFIPTFLDEDDPRPAREQFQERYQWGGWHPQDGFTTRGGRPTLYYPGDPPLHPLACMAFRDEVIFVYPGAYVAIFQPDGSFEACRMD